MHGSESFHSADARSSLLHGWEQRDNIVSIETTAGDLEIADPAEVTPIRTLG
jgi:hypothetical protein